VSKSTTIDAFRACAWPAIIQDAISARKITVCLKRPERPILFHPGAVISLPNSEGGKKFAGIYPESKVIKLSLIVYPMFLVNC
jgi:hypothetical protein